MMIMMKSSLPGPFLFIILLLIIRTVSGLGSVLVKSYTPVQHHYTWQGAQAFCRRSLYDTDLTIIYKQSDADSLNLQQYYAWIDMHKEFTPIFDWERNEPDSGDDCACIRYYEKRYYGTDCGEYYFFICNVKNHDDEYTFINQSMKWSDAQQYCKQLYGDLAVIRKNDDLNSAVQPQDFPVWIGLYRDGKVWKWSTGVSDYRNWAPNQPGKDGDCVAIYSMSKTMITQSCSARYPFICFKDNLVLVKENKTWEEALEYCQALGSQNNSPYQLVSVQPGDDYSYMMDRVTTEANTDEVWTGLRFLAGNWIWMNGADMLLSDLPLCPLSGQYCGAFSKNDTGSLETRDCLEKKNFLCYSLW